MSRLQVLVATMNQKDCMSLVKNMNITSDAVIINQSDECSYQMYKNGDNIIESYTVNERGLSRSRNTALIKSSGDLLCIADDDMVYSDTYETDILDEFDKNPDADAIVFRVVFINERQGASYKKKVGKLGRYEYKECSSVEMVVKKDKILANNIWFNALFGAGSKYSCGEDTIFIKEMLDKGLNVYKSDKQIAIVDMSESTWFKGYDERHFKNKGALVACIYKKMWLPVIVLLSLKNSKSKLGSYTRFFELFKWYYSGVSEFKKLQ